MTTHFLHLSSYTYIRVLDHEFTSDDEDLLLELDTRSNSSEEDDGDGVSVFDCTWLTVLTLCPDLALESVVGTGEKVHQWQIAVQ
jgi:hypothetical protein